MYNVLLQKSNDRRLLKDNIFNVSIDRNLSVFKHLKDYLAVRSIDIHTIDKSNPKDADCLIFFDLPYPNDFKSWYTIFKYRKKSILFIYEPPMVNPINYIRFLHKFFKKVFVWNDNQVDNKRYLKFYIQQSNLDLKIEKNSFSQKMFLVMINGNKLPFFLFYTISRFGKELYSERIRAIEYCEEHIPGRFSLYGRGWNQSKKYNLKEKFLKTKKYKVYQGEAGNKIEVLSQYKYCLCFENITGIDGFLTEKIFDCFKAKCVPIYWGAENIEKYIPKNCYIDYRNFLDYDELIQYLDDIDESVYNRYIENIEVLLKNKEFVNRWFEEGWIHFFYELIHDFISTSVNEQDQ